MVLLPRSSSRLLAFLADHERDLQPLPQEAGGDGLRRNGARQERHGRHAQDPQQDGADRRYRDAVPRDVVLQAVNRTAFSPKMCWGGGGVRQTTCPFASLKPQRSLHKFVAQVGG